MMWPGRLFGRDYVLLRTVNDQKTCKVRWYVGRPYAAPYLADTMAELMPDGSCDGPCYIKGWKPLTEGIAKWADYPTEAP